MHTGGDDTTPTFSGLHVYLQFTWELGLPPSPVDFSSHCHFYKLSHSWLLGVCHCSCLLWPACLFTAHVGSGLPPSPVEFSSFRHFYKLSHSWFLGVCCRSCLLQPTCEGFTLPSSLVLRAPSLLHVFVVVVIAYYSVSLFFPCGGQSVQGAMLIWPRVVCGSTAYCLAHFVLRVFPSRLGAGVWRHCGSPPGFFV
jgi:hypothetical protein